MKKILLIMLFSLFVTALFACAEETPMPMGSSGSESVCSANTAAPEWVGNTFGYSWEEDTSLNLFVEWIKSGGTKEIRGVRYDQYSYNSIFLDWVKGRENIVLPIIKNDAYSFHGVSISHKYNAYSITFSSKEGTVPLDERTLNFVFWPLDEAELKEGLEAAVNDLNKKYPTDVEFKHGTEKGPGGEYLFQEDIPGARFIVSDVLVTVAIYTSGEEKRTWDPKWFEYFDFETVSLK